MTTRAAQAERTRTAILNAAAGLIAERGFDATSLQQVADRADVTKANVYYYFRTKEAILSALFDPFVDALRTLVDQAEAIDDAGERRTMLIAGFTEQVLYSFRRIGSISLAADPALRRLLLENPTLRAGATRAEFLLFGADPTPRQVASWAVLQDLGPVLRRLHHLPDAQLLRILADLCDRTLLRHSDRD